VRYTCIDGYRLVGQRDVRCVGENTWSADPPVCQRIKCAPRNVANARASPNFGRYDFGSTVRYTCADGYRLVGERDVRCVGENTWSADPPVCERIKCAPRNSLNARESPKRYDFGSTVRYTCIDGYRLVGERDVRCVGENTWSADPPVCQRMKCAPRNIANARASPNFGRHYFGSTVRYTCAGGYRLVGERDVRCVGENTWSANPPVCERMKCAPRNVANGQRDVRCFGENTCVTYECFVGYLMVGSALSTCRDDTTWSTPQPVCLRMKCAPRNVANARALPNFGRYDFGSTVRYTCADGYRLVGEREAKCVEENSWSADPPVCETVANARTPPEGQSVWYSGDSVTYECFVGYLMVGSALSTCRDDTTWSTHKPVCLKNHCSNRDLFNGEVVPANVQMWAIGSNASYFCDEGFRLEGHSVASCEQGGVWSVDLPSCSAITCSDRNVANAVKSLNQVIWHVNDAVSFVCEEGYRLEGQAASTCLENGQWSAS
uniref:Sushi domain-containing protein n=1 Tax=Ciona savignyi TaxID=51511 RepID=H2YG37_CIOSA